MLPFRLPQFRRQEGGKGFPPFVHYQQFLSHATTVHPRSRFLKSTQVLTYAVRTLYDAFVSAEEVFRSPCFSAGGIGGFAATLRLRTHGAVGKGGECNSFRCVACTTR